MSLQQAYVLHTPASLKWTAAQEKSPSRDYPFQDHDAADPALFVQRTYLHFLWLPHSIMPLSLFTPPLLRIRGTPDLAEDQPHPLHTFIEPLLSLRAAANKYHHELPQIFADGGGAGEAEESMMWYALGYEKVNGSAERNEHLTGEDNAMLEEKWRSGWLECMEQREVQIQILLYFLKLFLPGPCTPLPPVELPPMDNISFLSPLVSLLNTSRTEIATRNKNERDWMQKFCRDVVEPLGVMTRAPARTRSMSISLAQEKAKERAASVGATQDKALQRALTRQISMSRTWKGKDRSTAAVPQKDTKMLAATAKRIIGRTNSQSQSSQSRAAPAITLVTATPVKKPPPRAKSNASARSSSPHFTGRSSSPLIARSSSLTLLDTDDNELPCASVPLLDFTCDSLGNVMEEDEDAEEEIWLPNSSPDVLLLGKSGWGVPSAASQVLHLDTPVRKRMKLGK
ncbi:hypothetical protein BDR06DRAFT_953706 [Suillus hirtellus]|nr:hypothetical protein BDR06DRAFT_953706 [Suillus hirtellus]